MGRYKPNGPDTSTEFTPPNIRTSVKNREADNELYLKVNVDIEQVDNMIEKIKEAENIMLNISARNNENEIEYYKYEIERLKKIHKEGAEIIREQDKLLQEYQDTIIRIAIKHEDIFSFKTPNQIRKLIDLKPIEQSKERQKESETISYYADEKLVKEITTYYK